MAFSIFNSDLSLRKDSPLTIAKGQEKQKAETEENEGKDKLPPLEIQLQYSITHPKLIDMKTWAPNFLSLHNLIISGTNHLGRLIGTEKSTFGRFGESLFEWVTASLYLGGIFHEVAGHGAAYREFGCSPKHDFVPPRWGNFYVFKCLPDLTYEEKAHGDARGMEATQFLSRHVAAKAMAGGEMPYNHSVFLANLKLDTTLYILTGSPLIFKLPNNFGGDGAGDPERYMNTMALKHYFEDIGNEIEYSCNSSKTSCEWRWPEGIKTNFSFNALKAGAIWNLLDPLFVLSWYNIGRYIGTGKKSIKLPWILPQTNFLMTPDGPEFILRVPFRLNSLKGALIDPYVSTTANYLGEERAYAFGTSVSNIKIESEKSGDFTFGFSFDIWNKPYLGWGGAAGAEISYTPVKNLWLLDSPTVGINFVYKTYGHLFGENLEEGYSLRSTLKFSL